MKKGYTVEKSVQIILSLLKQHGIRKVIASPGSTNMALVNSMQNDDFFEMFSCVDERSAAYMACGMAAECGEPVVISCTGATASRNYMPALTEAYYRKLPVLAITSTPFVSKIGHHNAQVIDRSVVPRDVARFSVTLPVVHNDDDVWDCEVKVNKAILELRRSGGGPVHINLPTTYENVYSVASLPVYRKITRIAHNDAFPEIPSGRIAVFIGSHGPWSSRASELLDRFCGLHNGVVVCDHTSGYKGRFRADTALVACQSCFDASALRADLLIHMGEISGDYYGIKWKGNAVWRVSQDGEIRDTFRRLSHVFDMDEIAFLNHYASSQGVAQTEYYELVHAKGEELRKGIPDVPFSNIWIASKLASRMPEDSTIHFGILNSLRAWNFYSIPASVEAFCNVGGFGIDGCLSSMIGASLVNGKRLYFCILGDLAFFYDLNSLGNRHLGANIRILLVNNGKGTEFRQYGHVSSVFGDDLDEFVAAAGHFGKQSPTLVKNFVESLGFHYLQASSKEGFEQVYEEFITPGVLGRPIVLEVFTNSEDEGNALTQFMNIDKDPQFKAKQMAKSLTMNILGKKSANYLKQMIKS